MCINASWFYKLPIVYEVMLCLFLKQNCPEGYWGEKGKKKSRKRRQEAGVFDVSGLCEIQSETILASFSSPDLQHAAEKGGLGSSPDKSDF